MKSIFKFLFLITVNLVCLSTSCDDDIENPYIFYVNNNCGETIHVYYNQYPPEKKTMTPYEALYLYCEHTVIHSGEKGKTWYSIEKLEAGADIQFVIFKESTMQKYTHKELIENCIYDTLYILSYKDVKQYNNTITYGKE